MDPIEIGSTIPAERMHSIIERISKKRSININYEKYQDRYIYSFFLAQTNREKDIALFSILSKFVNEIILKFYMKDLIKENIRKQDLHLKLEDRTNLLEEVQDLILDENLFVREKDRIYNEICDYLMENNSLIIDGYVRFRRRSFEELINKATDFALDHIQMEIEYDEFISMLKYFVDTNPPELDKVHLILKDNSFKLLDGNKEEIDNSDIEKSLNEFFQEELGMSDIILSSLIGLSPRKVFVHLEIGKEKDLLRILRKIFSHRIEICYGCDLCKIKKHIE